MDERVSFVSDGLTLAGVLHAPDAPSRERRPAFVVRGDDPYWKISLNRFLRFFASFSMNS